MFLRNSQIQDLKELAIFKENFQNQFVADCPNTLLKSGNINENTILLGN